MGEMTPLYVSMAQYEEITTDLRDHHGMKAITQSWKKRELGWTPCILDVQGYRQTVRIDFWESDAKSLFLLSYSHMLTL